MADGRSSKSSGKTGKKPAAKKPAAKKPAAQEEDQPKSRWRRILGGFKLPVLISIPAAIFGAVVFWENHHQAFEVGKPFMNPKAPTKRGYGIHISMTNNGNQPMVVDRASLSIPGNNHNAPIFFYIEDPRVFDQYSTNPERVTAERQRLPIALDANSAQSVVLLADPDTLNDGRTKLRIARQEQGRFCEFIRLGKPRPKLILHVDWGGVTLDGFPPWPGADPSREEEVRIAGKKLTQASWSAEVLGTRESPRTIRFKHRLAEADFGALATMTLYSPSQTGPVHQRELPLVGNNPTGFRLPPLERGRYLVAFQVDGEVVLTSRLRVPSKRSEYNLASRPRGFCSTPKGRYGPLIAAWVSELVARLRRLPSPLSHGAAPGTPGS